MVIDMKVHTQTDVILVDRTHNDCTNKYDGSEAIHIVIMGHVTRYAQLKIQINSKAKSIPVYFRENKIGNIFWYEFGWTKQISSIPLITQQDSLKIISTNFRFETSIYVRRPLSFFWTCFKLNKYISLTQIHINIEQMGNI